jgi:hypothetical protein
MAGPINPCSDCVAGFACHSKLPSTGHDVRKTHSGAVLNSVYTKMRLSRYRVALLDAPLHLHSEPFVLGIEAGAAGDRPTLQDSTQFETEVIMETCAACFWIK